MHNGPTLVTGGSGFAGLHLLTHLAGLGATDLHAWSGPGSQARPTSDAVTWRGVDLVNAASVDRAIAEIRPKRLYHLAGATHVGSSWQRPTSFLETNVRGAHFLLDAVRRHTPTCRVVVVTSGMIYRTSADDRRAVSEDAPVGPTSPYAFSKFAEDQLALHAAAADDLDIVVARPFNHTGPGQSADFAASSFAKQVASIEAGLAAPTIAVGNLDAARDFSDVRDVVDAYAALMTRGRRGVAYNIASGTAITMREVLDQLIALSSVPVSITTDPTRMRPADIPWMAGDATRLTTDTGWTPRIPLASTLSDLLTYWRRVLAPAR